ncbi:MAG: hypothetical protein FJX46_07925, partial [Alphaproteobacteria bacterium]|nr:hypothetical protein [Alphaproteobacteria bacterium]
MERVRRMGAALALAFALAAAGPAWAQADAARAHLARGEALLAQGLQGGDSGRLAEAASAFRAALAAAADFPERAYAYNRLGDALHRLGARQGDPRRLAEAIEAHQAAVDRFALDGGREHVFAIHDLGDTLASFGVLTGQRAPLEDAVRLLGMAADAAQRAGAAGPLANMRNTLGSALMGLANLSDDEAALIEAVAVYRAARAERPESAQVLGNLAEALRRLGERRAGTAELEEALAMLDRLDAPQLRAPLLLSLGVRETGTARLDRAAEEFRAALALTDRANAAASWARLADGLGATLLLRDERAGDERLLTEAIAALGGAL